MKAPIAQAEEIRHLELPIREHQSPELVLGVTRLELGGDLLAAGLTAIPTTDDIATGEAGWLELGSDSYAAGDFIVAIKDDDFVEGGVDDNSTILMRALGTSGRGSKRLIEAAVYDSTR